MASPGSGSSVPSAKLPWHERWRIWIRTAETAIVIGLWGGGIASIDNPTIASLLFIGGAIIGSVSIVAVPSLSVLQKYFFTTLVIFFFILSAVFVVFHQIAGEATSASGQLSQIEEVSGSRIQFVEIEPFYPPNASSSDPFLFKFSYKNNGSLAAEMPNTYFVALVPSSWKKHSTQSDYSAAEDAIMSVIIKQSSHTPFSDSGNQIQPGDTDFFEMGPKVSKGDYLKIQNGQLQIGFGFVLKYTDAATPPGYAKYTYFCAYLINNGSGGWNYCHSYNKVFVAKN